MRPYHNCKKEDPAGYLYSGHRQDGDEWTCPVCGEEWVYCEDEAEGGFWVAKSILEED